MLLVEMTRSASNTILILVQPVSLLYNTLQKEIALIAKNFRVRHP